MRFQLIILYFIMGITVSCAKHDERNVLIAEWNLTEVIHPTNQIVGQQSILQLTLSIQNITNDTLILILGNNPKDTDFGNFFFIRKKDSLYAKLFPLDVIDKVNFQPVNEYNLKLIIPPDSTKRFNVRKNISLPKNSNELLSKLERSFNNATLNYVYEEKNTRVKESKNSIYLDNITFKKSNNYKFYSGL